MRPTRPNTRHFLPPIGVTETELSNLRNRLAASKRQTYVTHIDVEVELLERLIKMAQRKNR